MGQEDPAYQVSIARKGWEPVPASRHPSMMPDGNKYQIIERKGMILMERPLEITEEAQRAERRRAQLQVRQKEEQLNAAPQGQFERNNKDAPLARVKKGYSPIAIPRCLHCFEGSSEPSLHSPKREYSAITSPRCGKFNSIPVLSRPGVR